MAALGSLLKRVPQRAGAGAAGCAQAVLSACHETGLALADRLGTKAVTFPGGHAGFFTHPDTFAEKLHEVLVADPVRSAR